MKEKVKERYNMPVTILLICGLITIIFPLYMTIVIAFKQPSEMTNSIAGILSLPKTWSFSNFAEAMRVTDFWNSLRNSLLITGVTVVLSVVLHSMVGYAIGRNKAKNKWYNLAYLYIVSGMFVPFAILMMPLVKQTAQWGIANIVGVIICGILYAYEPDAVCGLFSEYSYCFGRSGPGRRRVHLDDLLEDYFPDHEAYACHCGSYYGIKRMERRYDAAGYHVGERNEYPSAGADVFPDPVWYEL